MSDEQQPKQINFTIIPDDNSTAPRTYSNFCSIAHTPFDFTLTFCEVMPLSEKEIKEAESDHVVPRAGADQGGGARAVRAQPDCRTAGSIGASFPSRTAMSAGTKAPVPCTDETPRETREIMRQLESQHPNADTELHYTTPYELLVATILSAQSTDARVNMVTPALFKRYPDARTLARATTEELEPQILSTGFFRRNRRRSSAWRRRWSPSTAAKSRRAWTRSWSCPAWAARPRTSCWATRSACRPAVDRHVLRVANRIGIAESDDPRSSSSS
jgi:endonuclease-3